MSRILSGEEEAVLKAIFDQRAKSQWSSTFKYDTEEAQLFLHSIGAFSKYKLEKDKQFGIIDRLTNDGIIKSDYLVDATFINNYRSATHSNLPLIQSKERYYWYRNTDWAREAFGPDEFRSAEDVGRELGGGLVINMTVDDMNYIEENYMASHTVRLKLDIKKCCLCIRFDNEGKWRELKPHMNAGATTFKVLCAAYKNANKKMTAEQLGIKGKYIDTGVFISTTNVKILNPVLMELSRDSILFKTVARISQAQFEHLKKALKIS